MKPATQYFVRDVRDTYLPALLGSGVAMVILVVAMNPDKRILGAILGAFGVALIAFLSGNPRLFCLWGLGFSVGFDLSKRIGPIVQKMGGETAYRVEMADPFFFILLFFLFRDISRGERNGLKVPKVLIPWMIIMTWGVIMAITGPWRTSAMQEVIRMLKMTVLFVVICNELERPSRLLQGVCGLTLGVILQSCVAIAQFTTRKHFGLEILGETGAGTLKQLAADSVRAEKAFRAGAFLSHPNILGAYLAALLPFAIAAFLIKTTKAYRIFFLTATMLGMAALITTLSRSGWVSFAAAFMVIMFLMILHEQSRKRSIVAVVAASLALLVVCGIFFDRISSRVLASKASAMMSRAEYIRDASRMIAARPLFGWGLNAYVYEAPPFTQYGSHAAYLKYQNWLPPVHNIYLLWFAETGVVGLFVHLVMLGWILWIAVKNMRVPNEILYAMNAACIAAIAALMVDGMFSFSLRINSILRVFWIIAGIIFAIHYWDRQRKFEEANAEESAALVG